MSKKTTLSLILPAFGAALIVVLSQIVIPVGTVPFTLQTLAIGLIATLFRPREAVLSVLLYLLLGGIGLPVFAGGSGGFSALMGPTAGFLWGFVVYALTTSFLINPRTSLVVIFLANLLGAITTLVLGVLGLHFLANMTWQAAFSAGVLPFIVSDLIKILAITFISKPIFNALKQEEYFNQ